MSFEAPVLKKITFAFVAALAALGGLLYLFQSVTVSRLPKSQQRPPAVSPNQDVEFDSGALRREWLKKEEQK